MELGIPHIGEICALLAALTWAFALVLFKRSGEQVPPLSLNLFKNTIAIALLAITLAGIGEGFGSLLGFPAGDICILSLSGFIGIALADTLIFRALNLIGVGIMSIVDCLYSPLVILFSVLLLGEQLAPWHYLGGVLIVGGVAISSRHEPPPDRTARQVTVGVLLAAAALALMAFGIVIAKPSLDRVSVIWATTLRMVVGTVALALMALAARDRRRQWAVFVPARVWWYAVPAAVIGGYLAMIFWVAGFKWAQASIAGILNQTSVIFAIILATVILKEPFSRRKAVAAALSLAGVALVAGGEYLFG